MKTPFLRRLWMNFCGSIIMLYAFVLNRCRVKGNENIPREGGVLMASNHISAYDTVFLPCAVLLRYPLHMIWAPAKEELFSNPLIGWFLLSWGAFPVKRRRDTKAAVKINELLATEKVMVFPEGTRNRDGRLGKGNRGVGKIILDTKPVVIPTALVGLNRWKFFRLGQKGLVVFGKPVDFSDLLQREDNKETHVLITERVMAAIAGLLEAEGASPSPALEEDGKEKEIVAVKVH